MLECRKSVSSCVTFSQLRQPASKFSTESIEKKKKIIDAIGWLICHRLDSLSCIPSMYIAGTNRRSARILYIHIYRLMHGPTGRRAESRSRLLCMCAAAALIRPEGNSYYCYDRELCVCVCVSVADYSGTYIPRVSARHQFARETDGDGSVLLRSSKRQLL